MRGAHRRCSSCYSLYVFALLAPRFPGANTARFVLATVSMERPRRNTFEKPSQSPPTVKRALVHAASQLSTRKQASCLRATHNQTAPPPHHTHRTHRTRRRK